MIIVDQPLRRRAPLLRIAMKQIRRRPSGEHRHQLPAEVEGVAHRHIHPLPGLGAMRVTGIPGGEHARSARGRRITGHVVELVGQAVPDLVDRPPHHVFDVEVMRLQNTFCLGDDILDPKPPIRHALVLVELVEFDVKPHQIAALTRQNKNAALALRLDNGLHAKIGEIGHGKHIHHTPCLMRRIPMQFATNGSAHVAACPITADDIIGAHGLDLSRALWVRALKAHRNGIVARCLVNLEVQNPQPIVRFKPCWRILHDVEKEIMHPRLVDEDVRHFGNPVLHVLHAPDPFDLARLVRVRCPESRFIDPVGFTLHRLGKTKCLKHLHGAHVDPVRLPFFHAAHLGFDDHR